ncbi:unnamed protein product [Linum tenue]|nr:unnamed protein product [Linum tenue]
MVQSSSR